MIPGGKWALVGGAGAISLAASALVSAVTAIITGLGALDDWTNGDLSKKINAGGSVLESISAAIARVKSGFTKVYNEDLKDFGVAMATVRDGIEGINEDGSLDADMSSATEMASKLYEFFNSLQTYSLIDASGTLTGYTSVASLLLDDVSSFGTAIDALWNGVSGISKDKNVEGDIDTSIKVVTKLKTDFFDVIGKDETIPDGSGLIEYNNRISGVLEYVKTFGENVGTFHTNVGGLSTTSIEYDTSTAITIATKIAGFLEALGGMHIEQNAQGISAWFKDETKGETVIDTVADLATAMSKSSESFTGLSKTDITKDVETAVASLKSVASFLNYLSTDADVSSGSASNIDASWELTDKLQVVLGSLKRIAQELITFNDETKDIPLDDVAAVSRMISDFLQFGLAGADFNADTFLSGITYEAINGRISEIIGYVQSAISSNDSTIMSSGKTISESMLSGMKEKNSEFKTTGENFIRGLTNGVYFQTRFAIEAAAYVARQMVAAVKNTFQTASPSKVTTQIGKYFSEGLSNGVTEEGKNAADASKKVAENMMQTTKESLLPLSNTLFDDIDDNPVIRPVVDMSNIEAAKASIPNYFNDKINGLSISAKLANNVSGEFERQRANGKNGFKGIDLTSVAVKDGNDPDRYNVNSFNGTNILDIFNTKFEKLANAITNMQIVLDTGEFVGATSGAYDKQFGKMAGRKGRGN